jgi:hypothetical protein
MVCDAEEGCTAALHSGGDVSRTVALLSCNIRSKSGLLHSESRIILLFNSSLSPKGNYVCP